MLSCHAYEDFYGDKAPIPTKYLREMLYLILTENSFQFCGSTYLQHPWNSYGNKDGGCFCKHLHGQNRKTNIESELHQTAFLEKVYCDVFSLWNTSLDKIESFVKKANNFHSTIKFMAEMSETEITFLDTKVYVQRSKIRQGINPRRANTLQTNRNIPVHELLLVSPTRREERLHQRGSTQASKD